MRSVFKNFRLVDESTDTRGTLVVEDGIIHELIPDGRAGIEQAALVVDGNALPEGCVLMPAFVDLHAHFRDSGVTEPEPSLPSELIESGALAAAAGGFGTVICMANTTPVIDTREKVQRLRQRAAALALVDLFPVMSLSKGMKGTELSGLAELSPDSQNGPLMLSEDGKDLADDALFLAAMAQARRLGVPISCHCDFGGAEADAAKKAGTPRGVWSRIEENNAVQRVIELGKKAGCRIHIAHISTKEAVELARQTKALLAARPNAFPGFALTCEAMPHNFCLTEKDAAAMYPSAAPGEHGADTSETYGRVNPPLREEADRAALIAAIADGTIDAIATDHAPHRMADKAKGTPGFSGLETAFAAAYTQLVKRHGAANAGNLSLQRLSALMSANPARLAGLADRGRLCAGQKADLVIVDTEQAWIVEPARFRTRGKNSPFTGKQLFGTVIMTIHNGNIVFSGGLM